MTDIARQRRIAALKEVVARRILIIDGAMGTMIQRHKLDEAGYRGPRFADWPRDVAGNNDLLCLTQPRLNALLKGRLSQFSLDALVKIASRAGLNVRLVIKKAA